MPGEFEPHEATVMCWPVRRSIWGTHHDRAEDDFAAIAAAVGAFEPVIMVAPPSDAERAAKLCSAAGGTAVEVVVLPINDSWARDHGPMYAVDSGGRPVVVDFVFNAWGEKFTPYDDDALLARRWAERRGEQVRTSTMVLEGGAIAVDGQGTLVTTEQCLLHPNRNPSMGRSEMTDELAAMLGTTTVVWLPHGLALDHDTDGHVDNVAAFTRPGELLVQGCDDPTEADHERLAANASRLVGAVGAGGEPIDVVEVPVLPFTQLDDERLVVPYLNLYVCNGGVLVPTCGHPADDEMLGLISERFPGRRVVGVPGAVLALGGGGPHCITQQIPVSPGGDRLTEPVRG